MNVYQMYVANGNKAGFWVQRNSWGRTVARIKTVEGRTSGELCGVPPYFGSPEVRADVFSMAGELREADAELSCPGTYAYTRVQPPWETGTLKEVA